MSKDDDRSHLSEAFGKADETILARTRELIGQSEMLKAMQAAISGIVRAAPGKDDKSAVAQQQIGLLVRFLFSCRY